jgi:phosphatidylserine/phosphatidylglycerophosphate/cardiolipin synthase-like enzyme
MANQPLTDAQSVAGFSVKLWRGERMVLIGMDVEEPEPDLVGFSIEVQSPGSPQFFPLRNRLNFDYSDAPNAKTVDGYRNFDSTQAPFQKFRWIHFPYNPKDGVYEYRVTKQHMHDDGTLYAGTTITASIDLQTVIYDGFLDVGFTRGYASSQAYADKYGNNANIIPTDATEGLDYQKVPGDVYQWLGFEAYELLFDLLDEIVGDPTLTLDLFTYDFNEPDILSRLEKLGPRLRAIMDDSKGHGDDTDAESIAAARLGTSAGADNIHRMHFSGLQHNKVLIVKRNGEPYKVLFGSTNFSFRGLYIQANNTLVFQAPEIVSLFVDYFEQAFTHPAGFAGTPITSDWHTVSIKGKPAVSLCLSPHKDPALSLGKIGDAINQATSSVFFCIAFLNQAKTGAVREAVDDLTGKPLFSYGISDRDGGLTVHKPDGTLGIVDFQYLAAHAPEPFKSEWSGGAGIHEHDKFVVVDFNLPTAKVFTGSCNMSISGEKNNGDNLICIEDPRVATSYAIEALLIFDHLEFRTEMKGAEEPQALTLAKPTSISGKPTWFERFYVADSQTERDRKLFAH